MGPSISMRPSWSRDGRWIYFGSDRSGDFQIWKVPAEGGTAVPVGNTKGGVEALESLDGKAIYYSKGNEPGIWRVPVEGGGETRVVDQKGDGNWALSDQGILFFELNHPAGPVLNFYSFATHGVTLLRQFSRETRIGNYISAAPDGSWIIYSQLDQLASDLTLVENFR
jgi:hypothetical protein